MVVERTRAMVAFAVCSAQSHVSCPLAGRLDIVVGNGKRFTNPGGDTVNQLLLNLGGSSFHAIELPGGSLLTSSVALGDVDGDGTCVHRVGCFYRVLSCATEIVS